MTTYKATIEERGNGFAGVGEYVVATDGAVYRIVSTHGPIHTAGCGAPNYIHGVVEDADWDDIDDDSEPYCSAVVSDQPLERIHATKHHELRATQGD